MVPEAWHQKPQGVGTSPRPRGWTAGAAEHTFQPRALPAPQLVPHPRVSLGLLFFEETEDYIFYREQAVFLILYHFSDVIFTFAPNLLVG